MIWLIKQTIASNDYYDNIMAKWAHLQEQSDDSKSQICYNNVCEWFLHEYN
jgi:hypothetical protein